MAGGGGDEASSWDGPRSLRAQVERLWNRGRILSARVTGAPLFPLALRLKRPAAGEIAHQFEQVRQWIRALEAAAKENLGHGYVLQWDEVNHRQLGRNRVPVRALVPSAEDAIALIGREADAARFDALVAATQAVFPALERWLARKPLTALEHALDWERILSVVEWLAANPASGLYIRQIDLPGIDTKFIESRTGIIAELFDALGLSEVSPPRAGGVRFEQRFGLRERAALIRFRILDPTLAIGGLNDLTVPIDQFACLDLGARRIFIMENEINGLAFPSVELGIVIFKLGYALDLLAAVKWLETRDITYWGDNDTHGFAMLDKLRGMFPSARSMLMDAETFLAHRQSWSREEVQHVGELTRLTASEQRMLDDLRCNRYGDRLRLEQERVSLGRVRQALSEHAL